ncbi:MAG: FIST N-terminal domain-containing protein [Planctomycetota bacterium]
MTVPAQESETPIVPVGAAAISANVDAHLAAESVAEGILDQLEAGVRPDLLVAFVSGEHATQAAVVSQVLRRHLEPRHLFGATAVSVLAGGEDIENSAGVSALALKLPGARFTPFRYRDLPQGDSEDPKVIQRAATQLELGEDLRGVLFVGDPFSVPANRTVDVFSQLGGYERPRVPVIGGMASAGRGAGQNLLMLDDDLLNAGGIGMAISGEVTVDTLVSQGCRPIGRPMVITQCSKNIVRQLGGRPALELLQETIDELGAEDRALLEKGLFVGVVIDEYKERFGRGDFLIRSVLGIEKDSRALAFGDLVRAGQTVQFHVRDATTASEDLELLLDSQRIRDEAIGTLLFSCNGRGSAFFGEANHDARVTNSALGGQPLAGFHAAGEIGPIGDRSFVHGHSASMAIFRKWRFRV